MSDASSARMLVLDIGTSSIRAAVVTSDGTAVLERAQTLLPDSPADGIVEFDATEMAGVTLDLAHQVLNEAGPVEAVGISNQRASTIVWDRATGEPVGPGLGWQDLRTVGDCLALRAEGLRLAPNQSATKLRWLLDQADAARARDLCFGTVDTWIAWTLSEGELHVTDATNAGVTGLVVHSDASRWHDGTLAALNVPAAMMPDIVDSATVVGAATALPGAPPIAALLGDQQASLVGQGCVRPGDAKVTFGTGGMLDAVLAQAPSFETRGQAGSFPIVAWRLDGEITWGVEAVMLAAGTNVEWLRDGLGIISSSRESHDVAATVTDTGGVMYVPALLGLGTPSWDYGARGTFVGITRGTGRAEMVRAVLEGIAHRGADLVESAVADTGIVIDALRIDGGMSDNPTFVQALADASARPVEVAPEREATARGAALMAALAVGHFGGIDELAATWQPRVRVEPQQTLDRDAWRAAVERAEGWIPALTGIDF